MQPEGCFQAAGILKWPGISASSGSVQCGMDGQNASCGRQPGPAPGIFPCPLPGILLSGWPCWYFLCLSSCFTAERQLAEPVRIIERVWGLGRGRKGRLLSTALGSRGLECVGRAHTSALSLSPALGTAIKVARLPESPTGCDRLISGSPSPRGPGEETGNRPGCLRIEEAWLLAPSFHLSCPWILSWGRDENNGF